MSEEEKRDYSAYHRPPGKPIIPREVSPAVEEMIFKITGKWLRETIKACLCINKECNRHIDPSSEFRTPENMVEYSKSGLCQVCQDKIYARLKRNRKDEDENGGIASVAVKAISSED